MARRCGRATSRFTGDIRIYPTKLATVSVSLCFCLIFPSVAEAGLFSASDQVILLTPENVESVLINSTAAIVAEFYASWCGHCVAFSPVYKTLARDIKGRNGPNHLAAGVCNEKCYSLIIHSLLFSFSTLFNSTCICRIVALKLPR